MFYGTILVCLLLTTATAYAEPPAVGEILQMNMTLLCDTPQQVEAIIVAGQTGEPDAAKKAFTALVQTLNEKGDPTCYAQRARGEVIGVKYLGVLKNPSGKLFDRWVVGITGPYGPGAVLWSEPVDGA